MPVISIIVPVYKVEPYLHRCVDSILVQSFTDFELILVDDGSPDNCGKICDEYAVKDSRIHVIHQENGGLSAARNAGIDWVFANSDSEWLSFVDSDDWVDPQYLSLLYQAVKNQQTNVSVTDYISATTDKCFTEENYHFSSVLLEPESFWCNNKCSNVAWGKLYRKSLFIDIRFPVGKLHEDVFVTYKVIFAQERIALLDDKVYFYYTNPEGITGREWSLKRLDSLEGLEQQIQYFQEKRLNCALKHVVRDYCERAVIALDLMEKKGLGDKALWRKQKNKLRSLIHSYKQSFDIDNDYWILEKAMPIRAKLRLYKWMLNKKVREIAKK